MYLHRPDLLSLAFGLLFTTVGLVVLLGLAVPDGGLLLALLAVTAGLGVAGSLLTGDVHRRAGERLAHRAAARGSAALRADPRPTVQDEGPLSHLPAIDDPVFGAPIHPDDLDRAYRETFGDDDPAPQQRDGQT